MRIVASLLLQCILGIESSCSLQLAKLMSTQPPELATEGQAPTAAHARTRASALAGANCQLLLVVADARVRASLIRHLAVEILFDGQACDREVPTSSASRCLTLRGLSVLASVEGTTVGSHPTRRSVRVSQGAATIIPLLPRD